ncbi:unnamed protein product [Gadus morhua 'NCC']
MKTADPRLISRRNQEQRSERAGDHSSAPAHGSLQAALFQFSLGTKVAHRAVHSRTSCSTTASVRVFKMRNNHGTLSG